MKIVREIDVSMKIFTENKKGNRPTKNFVFYSNLFA